MMTLEEWAKDNCNRLQNGQCQLRKCLVRGGWEPGKPVGYEVATCEYLEVLKMVELQEELKAELERVKRHMAAMEQALARAAGYTTDIDRPCEKDRP